MNKAQQFPCLLYYILEDVNATEVVAEIKVPTREEHKELHSYEPSKISADYDFFVQQYIEQETIEQKFFNKKPRKVIHVAINSFDDPIIKRTEQKEGFVEWVGDFKSLM